MRSLEGAAADMAIAPQGMTIPWGQKAHKRLC